MNSIFSRILVGVDGSDASGLAVTLGARLAHEHGGTLLVASAIDWIPIIAEAEAASAMIDAGPLIEGLRQNADAILTEAAATAKRFDVDAQRTVLEGDAEGCLLQFANDSDVRLIVMGTHGRSGIGRLLLGSTTEAVLRRSTIPVLIVRPGTVLADTTRRCFERVLVAIDDSDPSDAAVETAIDLPLEDRRELIFTTDIDARETVGARNSSSVAVRNHLLEQSHELVTRAVGLAHEHGVRAVRDVREGPVVQSITAAATEQGADLLIVGSHGRRGIRRFVLGSVAESIVRSAPIPVMVVRRPVSASTAESENRRKTEVRKKTG